MDNERVIKVGEKSNEVIASIDLVTSAFNCAIVKIEKIELNQGYENKVRIQDMFFDIKTNAIIREFLGGIERGVKEILGTEKSYDDIGDFVGEKEIELKERVVGRKNELGLKLNK